MRNLSDSYPVIQVKEQTASRGEKATHVFNGEYKVNADGQTVSVNIAEYGDASGASAQLAQQRRQYQADRLLDEGSVADTSGTQLGRYSAYLLGQRNAAGSETKTNTIPDLIIWTNGRFYVECHGTGAYRFFNTSAI